MKDAKKHSKKPLARSSAAEYLTYISAVVDNRESIELRYEDENIWMTQKMIAELYGVSVPAICQHLDTLTKDRELEAATIKQYLIVQKEGNREVLQDAGKVTHELAKQYAETEFEKYRIIQDNLYESDFDRFVLSDDFRKIEKRLEKTEKKTEQQEKG